MTERYGCGIDFASVAAIDFHTHVEVDCHGRNAYDDELVNATRAYFKMGESAAAGVDDLRRTTGSATPRRWSSRSMQRRRRVTRPTPSRTSSRAPRATPTC